MRTILATLAAPRHPTLAALALLALLTAGCEIPGMNDGEKIAAAKEAEGRAIGGACRHSGRALEDCYVMNPKAQKAAIYNGWRDMDAYMRENKIESVRPDLVEAPGGDKARAAGKPVGEEDRPPEKASPAEKPGPADKKAGAKHSAGEAPAQPVTPRRFG